jgi:hypothetical protein
MSCICPINELIAYGCKCGELRREKEPIQEPCADVEDCNYNYNHEFVASLKTANSDNCQACNKTGWVKSQWSATYRMRCPACHKKCLRCDNTGIAMAGGFSDEMPCGDCSEITYYAPTKLHSREEINELYFSVIFAPKCNTAEKHGSVKRENERKLKLILSNLDSLKNHTDLESISFGCIIAAASLKLIDTAKYHELIKQYCPNY